jgi:hypothetical protein
MPDSITHKKIIAIMSRAYLFLIGIQALLVLKGRATSWELCRLVVTAEKVLKSDDRQSCVMVAVSSTDPCYGTF